MSSTWEQASLSREDDSMVALKIIHMSSLGRENGDKVILEDGTRKYKVQSIESMA